MEEYATRIIKMHDGRVIDNVELKKVSDNIEVKKSTYNKITLANKYRLGIRNTFNIFTKFVLLFVVFLFVILSVFAEYAGFQTVENELDKQRYSMYFDNTEDNRVLIKKQDKSAFTDEDYDKIQAIPNVDYIVKNDYFVDKGVMLYKEDIYNSVGLYGNLENIDKFEGTVDVGRMPESENEVIVLSSREQYVIENRLNEVLDQEFSVTTTNGAFEESAKVKIVGIKYNEDVNDFDIKIYVYDKVFNDMNIAKNKSFCTAKYLFNDKYTDTYVYSIIPSKKVQKGQVIVNDELKYQLTRGSIKNKPFTIYISHIFYEEELNLKVVGTYTKKNYKSVTGVDKDYVADNIFISEEDYNFLYNKPQYQSSVFVKDVKEIDETLNEMESIGINTKKISDFKVEDNGAYKQVMKIIKLIVTIGLVFVLFFISYFIIKIILKSRNVYYTTLRMLGATFKSVKRILDIELFTNSNIAYFVAIILIYLIKTNVFKWGYINTLVKFLTIREYILMYLIIVIMSRLISRRFARQIFKKSAISTYNEEV